MASNIDYAVLPTNGQYIQKGSNFFIAENVPSMKTEEYISTMDNFRGKLIFQVKKFEKKEFLSIKIL